MGRGGSESRIPHVAALDGARGAAVAGVLFFHGGHLLGGYLGVDFFFTLSGFLITSLLLAEVDRTGGVGLGGFWARRARRLLPALAVMLAGVAIYCVTFATSDQLAQIRGDALATLGYVANWREVYAHQDYWSLFRFPSPLNHTWSLAIEEQFYLVWPLVFVGLLAAFKRRTPKAVLVTALALAAVSSALMIALYDPANTARSYFGTDTRAAAILFGAALAAWLSISGPAKTRATRAALEGAGVIGVGFLVLCWTRLDGQSATLYRGGFLLCALAGTAVIAAAVHPQPGVISRVLSFRPLCLLGLISYGVYLYHWPIDVALDQKQTGLGGWALFAFQIAVTFAVSIASFVLVEQPIRRGALTSVQWRRFTPAIAVALVLMVFATTSGATPRLRVPPAPGPNSGAVAAKVRRDAPPGAQRVLLVGNSVAALLGPPFEQIREAPSLAVFDAGIIGCNFPPVITRLHPWPPCHPAWEADVVDRFRPDIVFWILSDPAGGLRYRGHVVKPCAEPYDSLYTDALRTEIARLGAHGAEVVLTTAAYERSVGGHSDRATDCDNALRRQVATATGTRLVDLFAYVCPRGHCAVERDGVTLRPDGQHYEGPGGELIARWLIDQARRPE